MMQLYWVFLITFLQASFGLTEALSDDGKLVATGVVAGVIFAAIFITTIAISLYLRHKDSQKISGTKTPKTYDEKSTAF